MSASSGSKDSSTQLRQPTSRDSASKQSITKSSTAPLTVSASRDSTSKFKISRNPSTQLSASASKASSATHSRNPSTRFSASSSKDASISVKSPDSRLHRLASRDSASKRPISKTTSSRLSTSESVDSTLKGKVSRIPSTQLSASASKVSSSISMKSSASGLHQPTSRDSASKPPISKTASSRSSASASKDSTSNDKRSKNVSDELSPAYVNKEKVGQEEVDGSQKTRKVDAFNNLKKLMPSFSKSKSSTASHASTGDRQSNMSSGVSDMGGHSLLSKPSRETSTGPKLIIPTVVNTGQPSVKSEEKETNEPLHTSLSHASSTPKKSTKKSANESVSEAPILATKSSAVETAKSSKPSNVLKKATSVEQSSVNSSKNDKSDTSEMSLQNADEQKSDKQTVPTKETQDISNQTGEEKTEKLSPQEQSESSALPNVMNVELSSTPSSENVVANSGKPFSEKKKKKSFKSSNATAAKKKRSARVSKILRKVSTPKSHAASLLRSIATPRMRTITTEPFDFDDKLRSIEEKPSNDKNAVVGTSIQVVEEGAEADDEKLEARSAEQSSPADDNERIAEASVGDKVSISVTEANSTEDGGATSPVEEAAPVAKPLTSVKEISKKRKKKKKKYSLVKIQKSSILSQAKAMNGSHEELDASSTFKGEKSVAKAFEKKLFQSSDTKHREKNAAATKPLLHAQGPFTVVDYQNLDEIEVLNKPTKKKETVGMPTAKILSKKFKKAAKNKSKRTTVDTSQKDIDEIEASEHKVAEEKESSVELSSPLGATAESSPGKQLSNNVVSSDTKPEGEIFASTATMTLLKLDEPAQEMADIEQGQEVEKEVLIKDDKEPMKAQNLIDQVEITTVTTPTEQLTTWAASFFGLLKPKTKVCLEEMGEEEEASAKQSSPLTISDSNDAPVSCGEEASAHGMVMSPKTKLCVEEAQQEMGMACGSDLGFPIIESFFTVNDGSAADTVDDLESKEKSKSAKKSGLASLFRSLRKYSHSHFRTSSTKSNSSPPKPNTELCLEEGTQDENMQSESGTEEVHLGFPTKSSLSAEEAQDLQPESMEDVRLGDTTESSLSTDCGCVPTLKTPRSKQCVKEAQDEIFVDEGDSEMKNDEPATWPTSFFGLLTPKTKACLEEAEYEDKIAAHHETSSVPTPDFDAVVAITSDEKASDSVVASLPCDETASMQDVMSLKTKLCVEEAEESCNYSEKSKAVINDDTDEHSIKSKQEEKSGMADRFKRSLRKLSKSRIRSSTKSNVEKPTPEPKDCLEEAEIQNKTETKDQNFARVQSPDTEPEVAMSSDEKVLDSVDVSLTCDEKSSTQDVMSPKTKKCVEEAQEIPLVNSNYSEKNKPVIQCVEAEKHSVKSENEKKLGMTNRFKGSIRKFSKRNFRSNAKIKAEKPDSEVCVENGLQSSVDGRVVVATGSPSDTPKTELCIEHVKAKAAEIDSETICVKAEHKPGPVCGADADDVKAVSPKGHSERKDPALGVVNASQGSDSDAEITMSCVPKTSDSVVACLSCDEKASAKGIMSSKTNPILEEAQEMTLVVDTSNSEKSQQVMNASDTDQQHSINNFGAKDPVACAVNGPGSEDKVKQAKKSRIADRFEGSVRMFSKRGNLAGSMITPQFESDSSTRSHKPTSNTEETNNKICIKNKAPCNLTEVNAESEGKRRQVASLVKDTPQKRPLNQEYLRVDAVSDEEVLALSKSIADFLGTPKSRLNVDDVQTTDFGDNSHENQLVLDSTVRVNGSKGSQEKSTGSKKHPGNNKAAKASGTEGFHRPPRPTMSPRKPLSSKNQQKNPSNEKKAQPPATNDEISVNNSFNDDLSVAMGCFSARKMVVMSDGNSQ